MKFLTYLLLFVNSSMLLHAQTESSPSESPPIFCSGKYEINPKFPGGEKALLLYLSMEFQIPKKVDSFEIHSTRMIAKFKITKEGETKDIEILRTIGPKWSIEFTRLIEEMPLWEPAFVNGCPVEIFYTLPLRIEFE